MKMYSVQVGAEKFQINELEHRHLQQLINNKDRSMFTTASGSFLVDKVTSIKPLGFTEYNAPEPKREYVSEAQREKNLRRLHISKLYLLKKWNKRGVEIPEEDQEDFDKFTAWFESPQRLAKRALKKQFKAEFFDVEFVDNDELEYCFQSWLPFHDGSRDPRDYKRADHTPDALGLREANSILGSA